MAGLFERRVSLGDNADREIDNPLAHVEDLDALDEDAKAFAEKVNPESPDYDLFIKAARVARDPIDISPESVPGLTPLEQRILARERYEGFWDQPKALRVTIATLCLGAIIQGWTQTGGNGSNQSFPEEFGLMIPSPEDPNHLIWKDNAAVWTFASVNAITYLAASIFGCWLSDPLQSWLLGRRGAVFASGLLILASVVGGACTHSWRQLFICRLILGLGMGAKASVVPIFGAEVSPPHLRGALVMNWQLMDAFGIFLGFTANLVVSKIGPLSWRFQIASAVIPTICLLSLIWATPESPRFLLKKGQLGEAYKSLLALRETPIQAARELYYANAQIQAEVSLLPPREGDVEEQSTKAQNGDAERNIMQYGGLRRRAVGTWRRATRHVDDSQLDDFQRRIKKTNYFTRLWQLGRDKRTRRATVAALVVMLGQQLCGVNILAFYSSTFFEDVNSTGKDAGMKALWLSWGIGLANFIFTFPTYYFIDKRGRRFLLLATYPGMALSMLAACLSFMIPNGNSARTPVIAFWIFVFFFFYSWGQGPVPFAYSSEIFPLLNREQGMSFAVFINLFFAGLLTLFVPQMTEGLKYGSSSAGPGQSRLLAIFAGLNVVSFILIFFLVPETAGATIQGQQEGSLNYISLEELNYIFGVSTIKHVRYQLQHVLPWAFGYAKFWLSKHVLSHKDAQEPEQIEDLYYWVSVKRLHRLEKQERAEHETDSERAEGDAHPDDNDDDDEIAPDEQP